MDAPTSAIIWTRVIEGIVHEEKALISLVVGGMVINTTVICYTYPQSVRRSLLITLHRLQNSIKKNFLLKGSFSRIVNTTDVKEKK